MTEFIKPRLVVSKCIEFEYCRYNGQIIRSEFVKELQPHVEFIPICPEVEIGLGIPRSPIRIISKTDSRFLIQPATGQDITARMLTFTHDFLSDQKTIDGFILKSRSPSCGIKDVKIYPPGEKNAPLGRGDGFFGEQVKAYFPNAAIEDEGRLNNAYIREHFLRKIFTYAMFRKISKAPKMSELVSFHTNNKFLFLAYNQKQFRELGRITANHDKNRVATVFQKYSQVLPLIFLKAPRCLSNINVVMHIFGYVSKDISSDEKKLFLNLIDRYRKGQISLPTITNLLKSWALRFNQKYLLNQSYFEPYPPELQHVENIDSCKVRDFWK